MSTDKAGGGAGDADGNASSLSSMPSMFVLALSLALMVGMAAGWYFRKVNRKRSGYHKKYDSFSSYSNGV